MHGGIPSQVFLPKGGRKARISIANKHQTVAQGGEFRSQGRKLRRLFATEDSAKVAQPHKHSGLQALQTGLGTRVFFEQQLPDFGGEFFFKHPGELSWPG